LITGPTALTGQEVKSYDLRAGATLVMAGLIADGETVINEAELVDRGYEDIVGRLKKLGADIRKQD
jgi:UDP-N-acetylglucosamine 1-carboxyvinyltransferase